MDGLHRQHFTLTIDFLQNSLASPSVQVGGWPGTDGDLHGGERHGGLVQDPPGLLPRHTLPPLHEPLLFQVTGVEKTWF